MNKKDFLVNLLSFILILFTLNLYSQNSILTDYIKKISAQYQKSEIYVKIFKYGALTPDEIEKLEKENYNFSEILIISAIYLNIEDEFSQLYNYIKAHPELNDLLYTYDLTEEEVIQTADEILKTEIKRIDYYDYKDYGRKIFYNLEAGGEMLYQFSNNEYSFYLSGGIWITPFDFISLSANYNIGYLPIEDKNNQYSYSIKQSGVDLGINLSVIKNFDIYLFTDFYKGEKDYESKSYTSKLKIGISNFALYPGFSYLTEIYPLPYTNTTATNSEIKSTSYFLELKILKSENFNWRIKYSYFTKSDQTYNNAFDIGLNYSSGDIFNFGLNYNLFLSSIDLNSHNITSDFSFRLSKNLTLNLGAGLNLYNVEETTSSFTGGHHNTKKSLSTTLNYSLSSSISLEF